jgi:hypothetical protein
LQSYRYSDRAAIGGEVPPVKMDDHGTNALAILAEYGVGGIFHREVKVADKKIGHVQWAVCTLASAALCFEGGRTTHQHTPAQQHGSGPRMGKDEMSKHGKTQLVNSLHRAGFVLAGKKKPYRPYIGRAFIKTRFISR